MNVSWSVNELHREDENVKVFGIGLNKTGTTTLGLCFRSLGYNHLSCRRDLLVAYRAGRKEEIFSTINKYDTFEDWPYPLMYADLFERYRDAKFVLTVRRDAQTWLRSLRRHSLSTHPFHHCRKYAYGYEYPFGHEEHHLEFYKRHNAEVKAFFADRAARDRLLILCWENGDGWPELARFLGKKAPNTEIPKANAAKRISYTSPRQLINRWRAGFWGTP